jgi:hypothetical protein
VIHHSVQTNGNPLTRGGREEVVSQEGAPTSSQGLFLSPDYRLTLENELHFSMDRNTTEIVKESYLGDKFHYSS